MDWQLRTTHRSGVITPGYKNGKSGVERLQSCLTHPFLAVASTAGLVEGFVVQRAFEASDSFFYSSSSSPLPVGVDKMITGVLKFLVLRVLPFTT